jgi:tetratricopeptide (TPR) repeat protein
MFDAGTLYAKVDAPQKALESHRQALALRSALVREQPGDPAAQRDLGRSHLALAELRVDLARVEEARVELNRARGVLVPLVRERPDDGGARRLEAECASLDGRLLENAGLPAEGRSSLEQARALYEGLIRDNPSYTLATAADGPTEYRRGLAEVLVRIGDTYHEEARHDEVLRYMEELQAVSEELVSGRFADDTDRLRLGLSYRKAGWALQFLRPHNEAIPVLKRALAILRRLADANPTVTAYKLEVAKCLSNIGQVYVGYDEAKARGSALEAIAVFRSLTPDQKQMALEVEGNSEMTLAESDQAQGRIDEAFLHHRRSVALFEEAVRAHPDFPYYQQEMGRSLVSLAVTELIAGDTEGARRTTGRIFALVEPVLRKHPDMRYVWNWKIVGLLVEGIVELRHGRASQASQLADRAATALQALKPPLNGQEHFFRGTVEAFRYATGRPVGDGRPAEPPGLRTHCERAIDEAREADRMGFRRPAATAMVDQILGGRPEMKLLLMDQFFPADPFPPDRGSDEEDWPPDARRPNP